jgi:hypothetical protein
MSKKLKLGMLVCWWMLPLKIGSKDKVLAWSSCSVRLEFCCVVAAQFDGDDVGASGCCDLIQPVYKTRRH